MNSEYLNIYLMQVSKYISTTDLTFLRQRLEHLSEQELRALQMLELQDPTMMLIISVLVGSLGVDRILLGQIGMGIAKLLTGGGCGIWWLIDLFLVMDETRRYNMAKINETLLMYGK